MNEITSVAVLLGGKSNEREVSLNSGKNVAEFIPKANYKVTTYDPASDLEQLTNDITSGKVDIVFPVLHGQFGEDGSIQGFCETLGIPYVGPGIEASAVCMNKITTKRLIMTHGVLTPEFELITKGNEPDMRNVTLPCVIKPGDGGSSVGISIPENFEEYKQGLATGFEESDVLLVEKFIEGREFTVGLIGHGDDIQVFPPTEIIPNSSKFYDYSAKYDKGGSTHICPAKLDEIHTETLQNLSKRCFKALGISGMVRIDFMYDEEEDLFYFIEANTIPGMTDTSLLPEAAKAAGLSFGELLSKLIEYGFERYKSDSPVLKPTSK